MEKNKKIWIGAGCSIAILGIAATTGVLIWKNGQTSEVTYRETTVWESDGWNYRRFHSEHWYSISDF